MIIDETIGKFNTQHAGAGWNESTNLKVNTVTIEVENPARDSIGNHICFISSKFFLYDRPK